MKKGPDEKSQPAGKLEPEAPPVLPAKGQGSQPAPAPDSGSSSLPTVVRWFISRTVRHATAMRKHVRRLVNSQRDILSAEAIREVEKPIDNLSAALKAGASRGQLEERMTELEVAANKWLRPYPNAIWRENVEVLLVALAVAMAIRTFFVQPFKIPTGSMQPTLFGVMSENLINQPDVVIPSGLERVKQWLQGVSYVHIVAPADGKLMAVSSPIRLLIFSLYQRVNVGGKWHSIWFPPDYGSATLEDRAGLQIGRDFKAGEDIVKLKVVAGDYLFVNRLTFNFRPPQRGEIVVFETRGIEPEARYMANPRQPIPGDQFYIKRLVGLSDEHLMINSNRHLVVNGIPLDASTPGFENVYGGDTTKYLGHLPIGKFADDQVFDVRPRHLVVMGDNTANSLDSRYFGDFEADSVIGKSWFVYWPLSKRFGLGYR